MDGQLLDTAVIDESRLRYTVMQQILAMLHFMDVTNGLSGVAGLQDRN